MPVSEVDPELDSVGPYNRLSASQVNSYRACQRMWFYEKVLKFKIRQIPVLYVGRAVEDAICKTLKESPSLLLATASEHTLSKIPIDEDGKPSRNGGNTWPANRILPLDKSQIPKSFDQIFDWAKQRVEKHLKSSLSAVKKDWERQERRSGDWSEVDFDYCLEMCINALNFHMIEVKRCYEKIDQQTLKSWRNGNREYWPSPDGYDFQLAGKHPLADEGKVTINEAWEIARPWFVEPEAGQFSMNSIHPEYWFQGEYDIVYRWDKNVKIVDIKASKGIGDRSGDYIDQLRMYAMLWWVTHEKDELVSDLEIWYLGANVVKTIPVPTESEMAVIEQELRLLWNDIKSHKVSIEQCPPNPSPLRGFSKGGVATNPPNGEVRCDRCDWKSVCSGGEGEEYREMQREYTLPGLITPIHPVSLQDLNVRFSLTTVVDSVNYRENDVPEIKIIQDGYRASVEIKVNKHQDGSSTYPHGLRKNDLIYLQNVIINSNYRGELIVKVDPLAKITTSSETECNDKLLDFRARWDIVGKLAYKYYRSGIGRNGREWHRKGMVVYDKNNAIKISGWSNDWGHQYDMADEGDYVLLSNIELDAWADQLRGQIGRHSRIDIIN